MNQLANSFDKIDELQFDKLVNIHKGYRKDGKCIECIPNPTLIDKDSSDIPSEYYGLLLIQRTMNDKLANRGNYSLKESGILKAICKIISMKVKNILLTHTHNLFRMQVNKSFTLISSIIDQSNPASIFNTVTQTLPS